MMAIYTIKSEETLKNFSDLPNCGGCCLYVDILNHYFLITKPHKLINNYHIICDYDLKYAIKYWGPLKIVYKRIIEEK